MSTNVPLTIWTPPSGNGEVTPSGNPTLDTEAAADLSTEAGGLLILEDTLYEPIPATVWVEDDSL